jgi:hypothetical protein
MIIFEENINSPFLDARYLLLLLLLLVLSDDPGLYPQRNPYFRLSSVKKGKTIPVTGHGGP